MSNHSATKWLEKHGDGVYDISLSVDCDKEAYNSCLSRGAIGVQAPTVTKDNFGKYGKSSIKTYGDTVHSFIWDKNYKGLWAPKFAELI